MRALALALAMLLPTPALSGTLALKITGVPEHIEGSVRASLTLARYLDRDISAPQLKRLMAGADEEIQEAVEPFGYYAARVTHHLETNGDHFDTEFRVTLGTPVRVTEARISVSDEAAQVPIVAAALKAFAPKQGAQLDHADYERSRDTITGALTSAGFLAARLRDHRVEVTRATYSATINLSWDCGTRYRFGTVRFSTTPLSNDLLARQVPWEEGDYYSGEKMLALQQRLNTGDFFSIVGVRPRLDEAQEDRVPIEVELSPARRDIYSGGVYVSTDTGAGVKGSFQRRWLNSSGHKFQADVEYAQRLQTGSLSYRIPFAGSRERAINFGVNYRDETTESTQERTSKLVLKESRRWGGFTRTLSLQLIGGDFDVGSEHGNSNELFGEIGLARTRSDEPAFPQHGYSFTTTLRVAPANVVSRTRFVAIESHAKWISSIGGRGRVILRGDIGAMAVDDFDELPPELRFFGGGDRSIRGFDYDAIGSQNDAGDVVGGTFLTVLSAEYEHYFAKKWGIATFVDGGDAFLQGDFNWNIGAGLGLRWKSPVGVVRVDVAVPVETSLTKSVRLHITIGPDL